MVRAVFFDKDGILNHLVEREQKKTMPYNVTEMLMIDGAKEGVNLIQNFGYKTFMITNQPEVSMGIAKKKDIEKILKINVDYYQFNGYNVCYDRNDEKYKPGTGMVQELAEKHGIELKSSIMIGDSWRDVVMGWKLGMRTYYIGQKENYFWPNEWSHVIPDYFVSHTFAACNHIINGGETR